jgi:hypothetical protein
MRGKEMILTQQKFSWKEPLTWPARLDIYELNYCCASHSEMVSDSFAREYGIKKGICEMA